MMVGRWPQGRRFDSEPKQYVPGFRGTVGESRRKILLTASRLSAGLRRLLAKHTPALLGMQSTVWGNSHMLPGRGVRVWVVYLTPKIERVINLLSASPVGEARCRCRKVWLTRIFIIIIMLLYWLLQIAGGLQNLVFVWAAEKCEETTPTPTNTLSETPTADAVPKPTPDSTITTPGTTPPGTDTEVTTNNPTDGPEQPATPGTTDGTTPATDNPATDTTDSPTTDTPAPATTAEVPLSGPPEDPVVTPGDTPIVTPGVTPGDTPLPDIPIGINPVIPPDNSQLPAIPEIPVDVNPIAPPGAPGLGGNPPAAVGPFPPVSPPAGVPVDGSTVCPPMPNMCSEEASPGSSAFCPVASPFTRARCEGGCCFSSGKCKMPLCTLNGLGAGECS
jgi:hypothetical protein